MNRRSFLKYSTASVVSFSAGVAGYHFLFGRKESRLALNLKPLFDPSFKEMAENMEPCMIFSELRNKDVIQSNGDLNTSAVHKLARTDQTTAYKGTYYTQTELELYSLAYLIRETNIVLQQ